jgi:hypothetical protein
MRRDYGARLGDNAHLKNSCKPAEYLAGWLLIAPIAIKSALIFTRMVRIVLARSDLRYTGRGSALRKVNMKFRVLLVIEFRATREH